MTKIVKADLQRFRQFLCLKMAVNAVEACGWLLRVCEYPRLAARAVTLGAPLR